MAEYLTPGVYQLNDDTPSVDTEVSVGVSGVVGIAQRGPVGIAVRITSWNQYIYNFAQGMDSPFMQNSDLAYSVYGFFQNGGSELVVVRAAHGTAVVAQMDIEDFDVKAADPGEWGNDLKVTVKKSEDDADVFNLVVSLNGTAVEYINGLVNDVTSGDYWVNRVNSESLFIVGEGGMLKECTNVVFTGGVDGIVDIEDADFISAIQAFKAYDDISFIAVPGRTSRQVHNALRAYAVEVSHVIPVLEAPLTSTVNGVRALRKAYEDTTGVLIYPWGYVTDPISKAANPIRLCPPAGHYMGVVSRISNLWGSWEAPAGTDATLRGFVNLSVELTKDDTDILNPAGVVVFKSIPNYGICVWGARTLNSKDKHYMYVTDLTLDGYIKRTCYNIGLPYVFRPNKPTTWADLETAVKGFMDELRSNNAFASMEKDYAYYVKCDKDLNDIHVKKQDGIIECEVGYAPAKPGEFIVFRTRHSVNAQ